MTVKFNDLSNEEKVQVNDLLQRTLRQELFTKETFEGMNIRTIEVFETSLTEALKNDWPYNHFILQEI